MPGTIWFPFRQGDRSEYLALYMLSALGVVVKVPREEDIGADFHCSLARFDGHRMTFYLPFLVQTKSTSIKKISYGGPDKEGRWKKEEIKWLFSQELPLMLGFINKEKMQLDLYSTSNMWPACYVGGQVGEVVLQPGLTMGSDEVKMPEATQVSSWPEGMKEQQRWTVPLGPPVVTISIDDVENQNRIDELRSILLDPLQMEQDNITYRRLQVHYSKWPHRFMTNSRDHFVYGLFYAANPVHGTNTDAQLKSLAPIIATLAFNFKTQGRLDELEKLKGVAGIMPKGSELDMLRKNVPELFK